MAMRRLLGDAGPSVDTVLTNPDLVPGEELHGEVRFTGGGSDAEVEYISVSLTGCVVGEDHDGDYEEEADLVQADLSDGFVLEAGADYVLPFTLTLPWDIPLTHMYGERLDGMVLGLYTDLAMLGNKDKSDLDEVFVHPLREQEVLFDAFQRLGFRFEGAELEVGELLIPGVRQTMPCFQTIEFSAPGGYGRLEEIELTFVTGSHSTEVVLELEKRGGLLSAPQEELQVFTIDHATAETIDWPAQIDDWLRESARARGIL